MKFRKGHSLKPKLVRPTGQVVFEDKDGNENIGDRFHCHSYGYRYNKVTGLCTIKSRIPPIRAKNIDKRHNKLLIWVLIILQLLTQNQSY